MKAFLDEETHMMKEMVNKIKAAGANVVLCQKGNRRHNSIVPGQGRNSRSPENQEIRHGETGEEQQEAKS